MKKIVFVFEENSLFVSSHMDKDTPAETRFFDSISYVMLPLIRMCENLIKDGIKFQFAISFSPIYCDMLTDKVFINRYRESLEKKLIFSENEKKRIGNDKKMLDALEDSIQFIKNNLSLFEKISCDIISKINSIARSGFIEIIPTTASSIFLPLYKRFPDAIHAQIQLGKLSYSNYFHANKIQGFYSPFLGFFRGMGKILKLYGYEYSILSGSAFLLSKKAPKSGVFAPAITDNGFKLLSTDTNTYYDLVFSPQAYQKNEIYLNNRSDIGFALHDRDYLLPLFDLEKGWQFVGFRYYSKKDGEVYDKNKAILQAKKDAYSFVNARYQILKEVEKSSSLKNPVSLMLMPSNLLGFKWTEGFIWLEEVFRCIDKIEDIETIFPRDAIALIEKPNKVEPFYSSLLDSNYSEELFTEDNDWIYRYVIKATERLKSIVNMFDSPTSLNIRTLNQATREVTLMQSAYWSILLNNKCYKNYATKKFKNLVKSFTYIYETLGAGMEETKCLTKREQEIPILKDIDYTCYKKR